MPLYRKITHGQFCSSAHRKAYWQEQERLAVERLHQTHDSLQAYRDLVPVDVAVPPSQYPPMQRAELAAPVLAAPVSVVPAPEPPAPAPEDWRVNLEPQGSLQVSLEAAREAAPPSAAEVEPPWAGFLAEAMTGAAPQWTSSTAGFDEPLFAAASRIVQPAVHLSVAHAPEPQNLEPLAEPEPDAPFAERMLALVPGPARTGAFDGGSASMSSSISSSISRAMDFPKRACFPLGDARLDADLATAGLVETGLRSPCISAGRPEPAPSHSAPLDVRTGPPALPGLQRAPLTEPTVRWAAPVEYGIQLVAALPAERTALRSPVEAAEIPPGDVALDLAIMDPKLVPAGAFKAADAQLWIPPAAAALPVPFPGTRKIQDQPLRTAAATHPGAISALFCMPQPSKVAVMLPQSHCEVLDAKPVADAFPAPLPGIGTPPPGLNAMGSPAQDAALGVGKPPRSALPSDTRQAASWKHVTDFWKHAPRDLRMLVFAIPALIALVFHPSPKVSFRAPQNNPIGSALGAQFANVKQSLVERAAVALDEDFRSGLDGWVSKGNATAAWSFDATGFVQPGPLALYQPSMALSDYQMQFLGMIDQKALSWVVRAADFENYYVIKLVVLKPGPLPEIGVTRYAVINGKAQNRADAVVPISARPDMLYRVRLDLSGDDFALEVQGQVVDSWSEPRLRRGGIGFFTARGEQSRVRWVQVTHQYDMLGRLCAYLAPYNIPTNGSW